MEYPVRQPTHLWVTALASVLAEGVREGGYLLECPKEGSVDGVAAEVAFVQVYAPPRLQRSCLTCRADNRIHQHDVSHYATFFSGNLQWIAPNLYYV